MERQAKTWADLWQVDEQYSLPAFSQGAQHLQPLLSFALRLAAFSFQIGTGHGADNISPRAFSRLSDTALKALGVLFASFEALGPWSQALDLVLIILLPKTDGRLRPIGLFPAVVRLWMRACVLRWLKHGKL